MPIADLYRTIDEHTVLKGRLETEQVFRKRYFLIQIIIIIFVCTKVLCRLGGSKKYYKHKCLF